MNYWELKMFHEKALSFLVSFFSLCLSRNRPHPGSPSPSFSSSPLQYYWMLQYTIRMHVCVYLLSYPNFILFIAATAHPKLDGFFFFLFLFWWWSKSKTGMGAICHVTQCVYNRKIFAQNVYHNNLQHTHTSYVYVVCLSQYKRNYI